MREKAEFCRITVDVGNHGDEGFFSFFFSRFLNVAAAGKAKWLRLKDIFDIDLKT